MDFEIRPLIQMEQEYKMYREKIEELIKWKKENNRSVLIIKGAPRTGKTWLLKEFGEKYYDKTIYIDLKDEADEESSNEVTNIKNLIEQKENEDIEKSIEDILKITEENKTEHLIILDNLEYNENAVNNLKKLLKSNRKFYRNRAECFKKHDKKNNICSKYRRK